MLWFQGSWTNWRCSTFQFSTHRWAPFCRMFRNIHGHHWAEAMHLRHDVQQSPVPNGLSFLEMDETRSRQLRLEARMSWSEQVQLTSTCWWFQLIALVAFLGCLASWTQWHRKAMLLPRDSFEDLDILNGSHRGLGRSWIALRTIPTPMSLSTWALVAGKLQDESRSRESGMLDDETHVVAFMMRKEALGKF